METVLLWNQKQLSFLGLLFEGDCGTKKEGFIDAIWKKKFLKSHMISCPLDFTNDLWIKSQGSHCKKGIDVGVHPFHRTKMAEKSSLFLPSPSHRRLSEGEVSLCCRGRRSQDQTCSVLLPVLCLVLPVSLGAGWRGAGSSPKFSSRAWWRAGHGFQQAGQGQAFLVALLTLGLELCWWAPRGLMGFVDAKTCEWFGAGSTMAVDQLCEPEQETEGRGLGSGKTRLEVLLSRASSIGEIGPKEALLSFYQAVSWTNWWLQRMRNARWAAEGGFVCEADGSCGWG